MPLRRRLIVAWEVTGNTELKVPVTSGRHAGAGASVCETYLDLGLQGEAMVGRRHSCARLHLWAL